MGHLSAFGCDFHLSMLSWFQHALWQRHLHAFAVHLHGVDVERVVAVIFQNERHGASCLSVEVAEVSLIVGEYQAWCFLGVEL